MFFGCRGQLIPDARVRKANICGKIDSGFFFNINSNNSRQLYRCLSLFPLICLGFNCICLYHITQVNLLNLVIRN